MKASQTKTMVAPRSRTVTARFRTFSLNFAVFVEYPQLRVFNVTFDGKLTFKSHLRMIANSASQKIGNMKRVWRLFGCLSIFLCFLSFILHLLVYCCPLWVSAGKSHLWLFHHVVLGATIWLGGVLPCESSSQSVFHIYCIGYTSVMEYCIR